MMILSLDPSVGRASSAELFCHVLPAFPSMQV